MPSPQDGLALRTDSFIKGREKEREGERERGRERERGHLITFSFHMVVL